MDKLIVDKKKKKHQVPDLPRSENGGTKLLVHTNTVHVLLVCVLREIY